MSDEGPAFATLGSPPAAGSVVLVAQAAYHLDELVPLAAELEARGHAAAVVCPLPRPSRLRRWRSSWWRHRELLNAATGYARAVSPPIQTAALLAGATAVVVSNDWGVPRALVESANDRGIPTFGHVEGVQDFHDLDTGQDRRPYRRVAHVLSLGDYDAAQLVGADVTPVGSERLWRAWHGPPTTADGSAVANVNFTYGVLGGVRRRWVEDVLSAAGSRPLVLSRHPADRGWRGRRRQSSTPVDELLRTAPRLVTRFSTLGYQALALGVDLVYHNPHGERVATFAAPGGAFTLTTTRSELAAALAGPPPAPQDARSRAAQFLHHHLVLDGPRPAVRAADAIVARLAG